MPRVIVTDKIASYQVAHRELVPSVAHRSRYLNNRAENSHQPTRQRERAMKRFTSPGHRNGSCRFSGISPHFRPPSAPAVGGRLPTGHGRPLRGRERDYRGDDHSRRLNRQLGQVFPSESTPNTRTIEPASPSPPIILTVPSIGVLSGEQLRPPLSSSRRSLFGNTIATIPVDGRSAEVLSSSPAARMRWSRAHAAQRSS